MRRPLLPSLRWYVRARLALTGAAATALVLTGEGLAPSQAPHPALLMARIGGPHAEDAADCALDVLRSRREVASERRLPDAEIVALLRREGVTLPAGAMPLPPLVEARLVPGADPLPAATALRRISGVTVDLARRLEPAPSRIGSRALIALATVTMLILAVLQEARARIGAVRLLGQLGMVRRGTLLRPVVAAGASVAAGIEAGSAAAWAVLAHPIGWALQSAIGVAETALVSILLAILLGRRA